MELSTIQLVQAIPANDNLMKNQKIQRDGNVSGLTMRRKQLDLRTRTMFAAPAAFSISRIHNSVKLF